MKMFSAAAATLVASGVLAQQTSTVTVDLSARISSITVFDDNPVFADLLTEFSLGQRLDFSATYVDPRDPNTGNLTLFSDPVPDLQFGFEGISTDELLRSEIETTTTTVVFGDGRSFPIQSTRILSLRNQFDGSGVSLDLASGDATFELGGGISLHELETGETHILNLLLTTVDTGGDLLTTTGPSAFRIAPGLGGAFRTPDGRESDSLMTLIPNADTLAALFEDSIELEFTGRTGIDGTDSFRIGFQIDSVVVTPTPGAASVLLLGGIIAGRRRR
ncbi:MAG: hypothetical protein AAGI17_11120 [Planctomycetota bacterium]